MTFEYRVARSTPVNVGKLDQELKAAIANVTGIATIPGFVRIFSEVAALTAGEQMTATNTVTAHNASSMTDSDLIELAKLACEDIKAYLLSEMRKVTPATVATIFTTVRDKVALNDDVARAVLNSTNLLNAVFVWTVATNPASILVTDRPKYIFIVWMVVGLPG